ncbi:hypothetical protein CAEBREN_07513 [Caenorhabditis brenneri]|uniref:Uncharacterized protein n=1 Tax=Caenorhabditis brenneri TaxID=135651 RepID=G0PKA5_CAEBE|nr:hypothetical protein CAEBREN_07513 [Caenorhabditis brenneri]
MKVHGKNVVFYAIFSFAAVFFIFYKADTIVYVSPFVPSTTGSSMEAAQPRISISRSETNKREVTNDPTPRFKFQSNTEKPVGVETVMAQEASINIEKNCECLSNKTMKSYDFCYRNPKNSSLIGKRFDCAHLNTLEELKLLDISEQTLVDLSNPNRDASDVMFVSAISMNHFGNFKEMYALIKKHWPQQKLVLYSLDLPDIRIKELEADPNIQVKKFNYSKYPKYVENWAEYRFKALILAEAIRDYKNVWWTDSHNRWLQPKPLGQFYGEMAKCQGDVDCDKKSSLMMFVNATHSNYAVLTEGLLDYFPTFGLDTLKYNDKGLQLSAAFVYLARTPFTLEILKWHALCSLEEKCMNPPNAKLKCDIIPRWEKYAGCFRYDQSSLNLLMFNSFRDHNHYFMNVGRVDRTYAHY